MASMHEINFQPSRTARGEPGGRESSPMMLAQLIEGEIIPRLLMAHRGDGCIVVAEAAGVHRDEVDAFVPLVLACDVPALIVSVESVLARGVALEAVYMDLLAPAARVLGEWWESDACDFIDVTMGLWRLQQVVHEMATRMPPQIRSHAAPRRAFFTVAPGSQHSFGLVMIEEFFRRAGWQTWSAVAPSTRQLVGMVERQWFELIGFTVSCTDDLGDLPGLIAAVRSASLNPAVGVMVGGPVFNESPELAATVGADSTAADGRTAVAAAELLLADAIRRAATPAGDPG